MILRWLDPADAQNYVDDISHLALLGVWGWNDSHEVQAHLQHLEDALKNTPPAADIGEVPCANVPDYGALYGTDVLYDLTPRSAWTRPVDEAPPLVAFVKYKRNITGDEVRVMAFLCTWAIVMRDNGDNVDRLVQAGRRGKG